MANKRVNDIHCHQSAKVKMLVTQSCLALFQL